MSGKRDKILRKDEKSVEYYDLNEQEQLQIGSLVALVEQARMAQDMFYTQIVQNVADRLEISNARLDLNMDEIMNNGAKYAKLVVKR